jgi:hypothetical protein
MIFFTVEPGIPDISSKKVEGNIISGDRIMMAARSSSRSQRLLFAYTHHEKARIWPRSAGV